MEAYQNAALSPEERAKDLLGKIMTPVLLVLIAVTFFGVLVKLPALFAAPNAYYAAQSASVRIPDLRETG